MKRSHRKPGSISIPGPEKVIDIMISDVQSSNLEWIGWPVTGEPLMIVQFKSGSRYAYIGVSRQRAVACAYAESSGHYLAERIKPNYEVVKLR